MWYFNTQYVHPRCHMVFWKLTPGSIYHGGQNTIWHRFFGGFVLHVFLVFCVFVFCFSLSCILCSKCCQCLWIVHSWFPLRFSLTFICFVCLRPVSCVPKLPVFLDCPFLISPSVFSNVYLFCLSSSCFLCTKVASVSWLSILDFPFGFL